VKDDKSAEIDEWVGLADQLLNRPLNWTAPAPADPSEFPVFRFVMFRAFIRAVTQYSSMLLLLKAGQWEDALILGRSLYELDLNLSKISGAKDPEADARQFVKFGKFQLIRLDQKQVTDDLQDARLKSEASVEIRDCEKQLADIAAKLDRDFREFRTSKGKWRDTWSGSNVDELAQDIARETGAQKGQSDYFVFKLGSLFTHNSPGSLFLGLPLEREMMNWDEFRATIDNAGRKGQRFFLHEASMCFIDIVAMAGGCIAGYERDWFDAFALPLLDKFLL
jgi:hypothetical protein